MGEPVGTVVRLAGALEVQHGGRRATERDLVGRQPRLMLAVLVWEHGRMVPHGELAEILWPIERPATWQPALRGLASKIRTLFDLAGLDGAEILTSESGCYRLDLPPGTVIDVLTAMARVEEATSLLGDGGDETARRLAGEARTVLSRPLLPGVDTPWLDRRRDELATALSRCLEVLGECRRRAGQHAHAAAVVEELLGREPFRETAWRLLMRIHAGAGNLAEALRTYERCRALLADELGVDPAPETQELHGHLLRSAPQPAHIPAPAESDRRPVSRIPGPPYRGLRAFEEPDADLFFGRDVEISGLIERLGEHRFVAAVGPSGCGKSSLVRAGLLPALRAGALPEADTWQRTVMVPGAHPIDALGAALIEVRDDEAVRAAVGRLDRDDGALHDAARTIVAGGPPGAQLLLVVDQFEELFTLCRDHQNRERFIGSLLHVTRRPDSRLVVVLTLRADFYGHAAAHSDLAAALSSSQLLVPPLDGHGFQQAIEGPARLAGLTLERGLTGRILSDVAGEPGSLPFLQHALLELYERRADHVLTRGAYEDIGGVSGTVARRAEDAWGALPPEHRKVARRIMLRLVEPGDDTADTRRRAALDELVAGPDTAAATDEVVARLVDARLVVVSGEPASGTRFIEIAHEALLAGWPRLAGWIDDERAGLHVHRRLTEQAQEWASHGRHPDFLLSGARLAQARDWASTHEEDVNPAERTYLRASIDAEEAAARRRARIRRGVTSGLTVALLVVGTLAFLASSQRARADRAEDEARSREVAAEASNQLNLDPELGLLLAMEAYDISPTAQAEAALRQALVTSNVRIRLPTDGSDPMVEVSPDGTFVATWTLGGDVIVWDAASGRRLVELRDPAPGFPDQQGLIGAIAFSPDARRLIASDLDGRASIWSLPEGHLLHTIEWPRTGTSVPVIAQEGADWAPDGSRVVLAAFDGTARVFDASSGALLAEARGPGEGSFLARARFDPDGRRLAVEGAAGTVGVIDLATGETVTETDGHDAPLWALKLSQDGTRLVTAGDDGTARIWDGASGQQLHAFAHDAPVRDAAIDPGGDRVMTGDANGNVRIWDATTGERLFDLTGHRARVNQLRFDHSGGLAVTASLDGTARVWDARSGALLGAMIGSTQPVVDVEFTPDGEHLITSGDDGRIWQVPQGPLSVIDAHDVSIHDVGFSADGRLLATGGVFDGLARVTDTDTGQVVMTVEHAASSKPYVDITADGSRLLTASTYQGPGLAQEPDPARVWDVDTGEAVVTIPLSDDDPYGVCGGRCALGDADFSPDGSQVAVAGFDGRVTVHDATTGEQLLVTDPLGGWLVAIEWSPDGRVLATRGFEVAEPLVIDARTGEVLHRLPAQEGLTVGAIRFSPDGTRVAVATGSAVRVYELDTQQLVADLRHRGATRDAAFNSDATMLATASESGSGIWDLATQRRLVSFPGTGAFAIEFTPDGERIAIGETDGVVRLYACDVCQPVDRLLELAQAAVTRQLTAAERVRFLHEEPPSRQTAPPSS